LKIHERTFAQLPDYQISQLLNSSMLHRSPLREGFHAAWRQPATVVAEIAWRWTFGSGALALITAGVMVYLSTLTVSRAELLAFRSRVPFLIADAVVHVLRGSGPRLVRLVLVLTPSLAVFWIATSTLGRVATLRRLVREPAEGGIWTLVQLNVLRAMLYVGSLVAYAGAAIVAGYAANRGLEPSPGIFLLAFVALALLITAARSRANWFPFLATIYAVRDGDTPQRALQRAASLFSRYSGQFVALGSGFGLLHLALAVVVTLMGLAVLGLVGHAGAGTIILLLVLISLAYFVVTDFLFIARLAAYVSIADEDINSLVPAPTIPTAPLPAEAPAS
jgi:hypothetical protein